MFTLSNLLFFSKRSFGAFLLVLINLLGTIGINLNFQGVYYDRKAYVSYSFYDSTRKVGVNEYLERNASYDIFLARNEREACQIVMRSNKDSGSDYRLEFSEFTNEDGQVLESQIYLEHYINCTTDKDYGTYPDALEPISRDKVITLRHNVNWPFYIEVRAGENTPAGQYKAQIKVTRLRGDGELQLITEVSATVWDFSLPVTPTMDTAFGLNRTYIQKVHNTASNPAKTQELYEKYYEFLVDHKISPYAIPVDILSDQADAYMSDPRIKSFIIPYPANDAKLQEYYAKVSSNPDWKKKGYFYPIDEPSGLEAYARYDTITDRLDRLCPGYNMVTPFGGVKFTADGQTYYPARLQQKSNIVCPISQDYSNKEFRALIDERRADGSKIWWYICCVPNPDTKYANIFTQSDGIEGRLLMWQQKKLDINGLLYWDTTYWNYVVNPWASAWTTPWTGNDTFGDGSLLYNGPDGPYPSLRLKYVSDGIEDFEYLTMAKELFGNDYIMKKIDKVTNSLEDYTRDDSLLAKVRLEIGKDLEKALANS